MLLHRHQDPEEFEISSDAKRDAHGLYRTYGFEAPASPASLMEVLDPDVYRRAAPER
jgi:hypothetical protein